MFKKKKYYSKLVEIILNRTFSCNMYDLPLGSCCFLATTNYECSTKLKNCFTWPHIINITHLSWHQRWVTFIQGKKIEKRGVTDKHSLVCTCASKTLVTNRSGDHSEIERWRLNWLFVLVKGHLFHLFYHWSNNSLYDWLSGIYSDFSGHINMGPHQSCVSSYSIGWSTWQTSVNVIQGYPARMFQSQSITMPALFSPFFN